SPARPFAPSSLHPERAVLFGNRLGPLQLHWLASRAATAVRKAAWLQARLLAERGRPVARSSCSGSRPEPGTKRRRKSSTASPRARLLSASSPPAAATR